MDCAAFGTFLTRWRPIFDAFLARYMQLLASRFSIRIDSHPIPRKSYKIAAMASLLSPREASLRLGISYPTIKQWIYHGKLKAVKTPGGHYRIAEAELDKFLAKSKRADAPVKKGPRTVSGRNQLVGRVVELKIEGLLAQVKLSIGNQIITSIITSESAREMGLKVGDTAAALIKSTEVMVIKP